MATIELQSIEIDGDPKESGDAKLPVRLVYADDLLAENARTYIEVRVESNAGYGRVLAEVELDALQEAKSLINVQIQRLRSLEGQRT